jgi:small subunit ribosomal protein S1
MKKRNNQNIEWDDSADMTMEEFDQAISGALIPTEPQPGDKVSGKVIALSETSVFVDINAKSEGVMAIEEFVNTDGTLTVTIGEIITATVIQVSDEIRLSHRMRKKDQTFEMIQEAFSGGIPVEGHVTGTNKGGLDVSLGEFRAFCPVSQIDIDHVDDPSIFVGNSFHFSITRMDSKGRNIIVSRSKYLKDERQKKARETLARIKIGDIANGQIRRIAEFGIFVDIGGIDGLVHVSRLSWDRISNPNEIFNTGENVRVKILDINHESGQISLSIRDAMPSPWDNYIGTEIIEGGTYYGEVVRIENFGAFVRIRPGLEGLLHISEIDWDQRIRHPSDRLKNGDVILVKVIGIDTDQQRISLSLKQVQSDPWPDDMSEGSVFEASVLNIRTQGLEVVLADGLTGFVPISKTGIASNASLRNSFKTDQSVTVKVLEGDRQKRRIILEIIDASAVQTADDVQKYLLNSDENSSRGFGSLGGRLQQALNKNRQRNKNL